MASIPYEAKSPPDAKARIQRLLRLTPLFERASRASREAALAVAEVEVVPAQTAVIEQGSPAEALVLLGRGRARIERIVKEGLVVPLGYRGAGDLLNEGCLGRVKRHGERATAMEESEIVRVPQRQVLDLMASDPAMGAAALALLVARQREVEDRIESLLFRDVEGRLAEFLLKAADRWGVPMPKGTLISAPITHLEIAQSIGSTRETVTLTLGALRREGLLDVAGRRLIVKDRAALAGRQ